MLMTTTIRKCSRLFRDYDGFKATETPRWLKEAELQKVFTKESRDRVFEHKPVSIYVGLFIMCDIYRYPSRRSL